ncbi:MAG: hypothetical protein RL557_680 [archaeon]|jgi:hypothetical protein
MRKSLLTTLLFGVSLASFGGGWILREYKDHLSLLSCYAYSYLFSAPKENPAVSSEVTQTSYESLYKDESSLVDYIDREDEKIKLSEPLVLHVPGGVDFAKDIVCQGDDDHHYKVKVNVDERRVTIRP